MGIKIAIVAGMLIACLSGVFYWYYNDTQARIATLRENNAKLEVAVNTAESSLDLVKTEMAKVGELNNQLQKSLQKSEAYGDDLRNKLTFSIVVLRILELCPKPRKLAREHRHPKFMI